jgi:hypothetical protein
MSPVAPVILVVLKDKKDKLCILVHPELSNMVQRDDLAYVESLLQDFLQRASLHPAALFKQLSALGVGPLVTYQAGSSISDHPPLLELCLRFVQL